MKLILDIGNTLVKLAVFEKDTLVDVRKCELKDLLKSVKEIKENYSVTKGIVSSVSHVDKGVMNRLMKEVDLIELSIGSKVEFDNCYQTTNTLGLDRVALVSAAIEQFPNKNTLIIDSGTCISYDFVNGQKEYLGGAISPGIQLRYKSLNDYTANLPRLEISESFKLIGDSTKSCIHSGVLNGVVNEIDGAINSYRLKYFDLTVVLTGGDTNFLAKQLKNTIFANQNFLLYGLNRILTLNNDE